MKNLCFQWILMGFFLSLPAWTYAGDDRGKTDGVSDRLLSYVDYNVFDLFATPFTGDLAATQVLSCQGGTIAADIGLDTLYLCRAGSGGLDDSIFNFSISGEQGSVVCYIVTDTLGNILEVLISTEADFSAYPVGEYWVWAVAFDGAFFGQPGGNVYTSTLSSDCWEMTSNYIVTYIDSVAGGSVLTEAGADTVSLCLGSGNEVVAFDSTGAAGSHFAYVVTDPNGVILGLSGSDEVDFSGTGPGECWVWGLSFSGNVLAQVGDTAGTIALTDGCYDLSANYVVVLRDSVDGGMVMTEAGADTVSLCLGSGITIVSFDSTATYGGTFTYVVTDPNGVILSLPGSDEVDFAGAGSGECWVWGLSFTGNVLAQVGDTAGTIALTDGCFDLSDNYVVVMRDSVDGGMVMTEAGADTILVCLGSSNEVVSFDSTGAFGGTFTYVVTDPNGVILGLPGSDEVDFSGAGIGECWVWGLSFTGNVLAQVGDTAGTIALTDGCFDLSDNYVVVIRDSVDGGMVMTEAGTDTVSLCLGSGVTVVAFDSAAVFGGTFTYVVTDPNGVILGLPGSDEVDFAGAGPGECWVWGLSFTGNVLAQVGDTAGTIALTDGCFDLSDNYVVVLRDSVSGGMVSAAGNDTALVCLSQPGPAISFDSTGTLGPNFVYVVTDTNTVILDITAADTINFSQAGVGVCWVWGLSFTGNPLVQVGDTAANAILTDGCYSLSSNYVIVIRDTAGIACGGNVIGGGTTPNWVTRYPVPTDAQLHITMQAGEAADARTSIEVFDLAGNRLLLQQFDTQANQLNRFDLDVDHLNAGVYILVCRNAGEVNTSKFMKQ